MAGGRHETRCTGLARTREDFPQHISIQQLLKQAKFFAESVCRDKLVVDLRLGTMKRLMAHWVLHACAGATSLGHSKMHQGLRREPLAARAAREHLNGTHLR